MTSHDREFMNRIITKVVEIDGGALTTYSGNYEFYEQQRALAEKQQQAQFERQQAMLAKEIKFIERFKARASHAAQVQSRVKKLDKVERVEPPKRRQTVAFKFQPAPRSGEDVVSLRKVHKGYGSRSIYAGLDFAVRRRERWCVMGVNGAGKSTLLKLVAGATRSIFSSFLTRLCTWAACEARALKRSMNLISLASIACWRSNWACCCFSFSARCCS